MQILFTLVAFAVAIGVLVVVHEFGHYSVARLCGVRVLRFSIGFGRPLYTRRDRHGTEWSLAALPFGGYVAMLDEREAEQPIPPEHLPHAFNRQSVWRRIAIVAAGPIANFLLAILLFAGVYAVGVQDVVPVLDAPSAGTPAARIGLKEGDTVVAADFGRGMQPVRGWNDLRWQLIGAPGDAHSVLLGIRRGDARRDYQLPLGETTAVDAQGQAIDPLARAGLAPRASAVAFGRIEPGSPAEQAGLHAGDELLSLNGTPLHAAAAFIDAVRAAPQQQLDLAIRRDGQLRRLSLTPRRLPNGTGQIGAGVGERLPGVDVHYGPLQALALGLRRTQNVAVLSVRMFGRMLTGEASLRNLSGPVTIADQAGRSARIGPSAFLSFLALVSISIGVLNLLPIPVLDGGHLLYYAVEAATGRAVSLRTQGYLRYAGLLCVLALSGVALYNDLARLLQS